MSFAKDLERCSIEFRNKCETTDNCSGYDMNSDQTIKAIFVHLLNHHPELSSLIPSRKVPLSEQTSISFEGDRNATDLARSVGKAFDSALQLSHNLPEWIVEMEGMSGRKYRYFINNLINQISDARYLEIGSWAGSTACSAIYGNALTATCVDDWSLFGGPKDKFLANVENAKGVGCNFRFMESDFRKINWSEKALNANVYLFDGPHEEQDQYDGITLVVPSLSDEFILIVDDYNWINVQKGTSRAINDLDMSIKFSIKVLTTTNNSHPVVLQGPNSDWHNGYFIGVISK